MAKYSIIVPVYNRIDEVEDLLKSLSEQTFRDFEVIIVEDGSTEPCKDAVEKYQPVLDVKYFYKSNEGRSIARNFGIEKSTGDYLIFFDSDCVIPPGYFATVTEALAQYPLDCYGGPDSAHESFSTTQRAINVAMTSYLTTGGIRGGKVSMEKFTPRTFNMGFSRRVYDSVGGFREMFSEDIDMSMRIRNAGFSTGLLHRAAVFHKRRIDFRKFFRQVYVFGMSRISLHFLYPGSMKPVHTLPALALILGSLMLLLGCLVSPWWFLPPALYLAAVFVSAWCSTRSFVIAVKAVPASVIQIAGYGCGFLKAFVEKIVLARGRDVEAEIEIRKGANEKLK